MELGIDFTITNLNKDQSNFINQSAKILYEGFKEHWKEAWTDMESALKEVNESLTEDKINRIVVKNNEILGWIGGIPQYNGNVWELHPLVVKKEYQNHGIGKKLVMDFEEIVKAKGALTILLGTDDEDFMTSLSGKNLYPDVWKHVHSIKNLKRHPYEFYMKLGYSIVGVVPDANGIGKPDIVMAKRVNS
jgi:aminoglycoside 6'-N-acetyltransferase I